MNSFSLIRTNTKLTTNIKLVVSSNYELFLESYNSVPELESSKFKKFQFTKSDFYDELVPLFFKGLSPTIAYSVKYDNDNDLMFKDYNKQFDDIYMSGCSNIEDTNYSEEFECIAPLHISPNNIPTNFIIFRVDGTGVIELDKDSFRKEILDKFKCVTTFDLSDRTPLGEFLYKNYNNNESFPSTPFEMDVRENEFSQWNGIEFESGGYTSKSLFIDDWLSKEKNFFEFDKFITNGYEINKVIYPNILNFKFLFDDTPGNKDSLNKWSINRYYGFYIDSMDLITSLSFYAPHELETDLIIGTGNIFKNSNGDKIKPIKRNWDEGISYYIEYNGSFYIIQRFIESNQINNSYTYKIISDLDLSGKQYMLNKNILSIGDNNLLSYDIKYNSSIFNIDGFDKADVWLIEINSKMHVIKKKNNSYYIQSDYTFKLNNNKLEYYINKIDPSFTTTVDLSDVSVINEPQRVKVYRLNFTDIKDFDNSIINTEWSNFEYDELDTISTTDEPKLYRVNLSDNGEPKQFDEFIYNGKLSKIPTTSEYIATSEIFEIFKNNTILSDIWRKNSIFCKWGYKGSISNNDSVYKANNSLLGDDFNRTSNVFKILPNRIERNLDYFYTINPNSNKYIKHSLHITDYINNYKSINNSFKFDVNMYMNIGIGILSYVNNIGYSKYTTDGVHNYNVGDIITPVGMNSLIDIPQTITSKTSTTIITSLLYSNTLSIIPNSARFSPNYTSDYFNYFFRKKEAFLNGDIIQNSNKHSTFNEGGNVTTNSTLFRGIKFNIYNINNLLFKNVTQIDKISIKPTNIFEGFKLSILLSKNSHRIVKNGSNSSTNTLEWMVFTTWQLGKKYNIGDVVYYFDTLYIANNLSIIDDGNINPATSLDWSLFSSVSNITWNKTKTYLNVNMDFVSVFDEFYVLNSLNPGVVDFWDVDTAYVVGDKIIYKSLVYVCANNNIFSPPEINGKTTTNWLAVTDYSTFTLKWSIIKQWELNSTYSTNGYVIFNGSLYIKENAINNNIIPSESNNWKFVYEKSPNPNRIYGINIINNNLVFMNGSYYLCTSNTNLDTLDSGIDIYINKKWKNLLINIYINDNTLIGLSNSNRDNLYDSLFSNLTAKNFMDSINDMENKYGFSNYVRYIVIEKDDTYNIYQYGDNISDLKYLLETQGPDELQIRTNSFKTNGVSPNSNLFKSNKQLENSEISDLKSLNNYNGDKLGSEFIINNNDINIVDNFSGQRNINYIPIYRYSGNYTPILHTVELFERAGDKSSDLIGNYKFDTTLTKFGIMKERIFSKVNIEGNILKLKNLDNYNSIYPMIDEFGYSFVEHFIFKSTWDKKYYISSENNI